MGTIGLSSFLSSDVFVFCLIKMSVKEIQMLRLLSSSYPDLFKLIVGGGLS